MVLIESIDSFLEQAEALYKQNPLKARYVIKYTHSKGKLVLKVTDDRSTVQFKTDQQTDLKKVGLLCGAFPFWGKFGCCHFYFIILVQVRLHYICR